MTIKAKLINLRLCWYFISILGFLRLHWNFFDPYMYTYTPKPSALRLKTEGMRGRIWPLEALLSSDILGESNERTTIRCYTAVHSHFCEAPSKWYTTLDINVILTPRIYCILSNFWASIWNPKLISPLMGAKLHLDNSTSWIKLSARHCCHVRIVHQVS